MDKWLNQIIQGDCLEVMRDIPDKSVDSIITDPPYGIDLQPQRGITQAIEGDKPQEARDLWAKFVPETYRILKDNTASIFFARWSEVWCKEILEQYFTVKACIVWVKNNFGIGYYTRPQHEFIWYCHKGKPPLPQTPQSDVWMEPKVLKPIHSCEKPTGLIERAIGFTSSENSIILDPFLGSGTTAVAALNTGRFFIGIEKEPKYVEIARKRVKAAQAQRSLFGTM